MTSEKDDVPVNTRERTLTAKGAENRLHILTNARRGKLSQLTAKSNEIDLLLNSEELPAVHDIQKEFKVYKKQYEEFNECNCAVASCLNAEEKEGFGFNQRMNNACVA